MELNVLITRNQIERLIEEPDTELVIYYPDGSKVIVRIDENEPVVENSTVH